MACKGSLRLSYDAIQITIHGRLSLACVECTGRRYRGLKGEKRWEGVLLHQNTRPQRGLNGGKGSLAGGRNPLVRRQDRCEPPIWQPLPPPCPSTYTGICWPDQWHMLAIHWPILNGPWPTPAPIVLKQKLGFRPEDSFSMASPCLLLNTNDIGIRFSHRSILDHTGILFLNETSTLFLKHRLRILSVINEW